MEEYITRFSTYLFWDVNKDDLDMEKHSQYIIKRVLEYGMLQDWNIVKQYYGLGRIVEIAKGFRELEPRALAYLSQNCIILFFIAFIKNSTKFFFIRN